MKLKRKKVGVLELKFIEIKVILFPDERVLFPDKGLLFPYQ